MVRCFPPEEVIAGSSPAVDFSFCLTQAHLFFAPKTAAPNYERVLGIFCPITPIHVTCKHIIRAAALCAPTGVRTPKICRIWSHSKFFTIFATETSSKLPIQQT